MAVHYEIKQDLPVIGEYDVVVAGGGPGGLGAAVMAARQGVSVLLVERYGFLGGMASVGEVQPFMANHANDKTLDRPVYVEWIEGMKKYLSEDSKFRNIGNPEMDGNDRTIHKDIAMLAAEDLCLEAGVKLLYHHTVFDVVKDGDRIDSLVLSSKSGLSAVKAKVFVDCSGDADLSARAGCECMVGNDEGFCQPMTLCFKLCNVKLEEEYCPDAVYRFRKKATEAYLKAKEKGEIDCPRENVLMFWWVRDDVIHFNTTRVIKKSALDGQELSEAEVMARKQMRQLIKVLRRDVSEFRDAEILSVAGHIGVRESRRVRGMDFITIDAFEQAKKFDDAIARVNYPIDIHNPSGTGTDLRHLPPTDWYEIPYGCIVAKGVDNLLVGGRPISVDHAIHSSMRVMPPAISVGSAAGMAAALSARADSVPRDLDGKAVRAELVKAGANL